LVGAPVALLVDAVLLLLSATILSGVRVADVPVVQTDVHFWRDLKLGVRFVIGKSILVSLAVTVGLWQLCYNAALVVQILFATRVLGLGEHAVGLCYMGMGIGTILASVYGNRISRHLGPGPCLVMGVAICGLGWLMLAIAPANALGIAAFVLMLMCFSVGGVLIFINFLALRQGRHTRTSIGPHDEHDALADTDSRRSRRANRGLDGRTPRLAIFARLCGPIRLGAGCGSVAESGDSGN